VIRESPSRREAPTGDFPADFIGDLLSAEQRAATPLCAPDAGNPAWEPPPLGQMIGRCYLSALIGEGATAVVYRALHVSLKIDVAVKVFRPADEASHGATTLSLHEAQVLARLSHQNIVRVLDAADHEPWPHLVMEFVDGPSLSELLAQTGRLPPETAIHLLLQVAEGLVHAHAAGVTHCDIKPGNILVDRQQVAKLTDLGVARATAGGPHHERKVAGTPAYIAPEVVQDGIGAATPAADIYSLGATGFHLVTGEPPHVDPDPLRMMIMHVQCAAPRASTRVLGLPHRLDGLLARMLNRDPAARPTAGELVAELRGLQHQAQGFARPDRARLPNQIYATLGRAWRDLRVALDQVLRRS
jgi:serine/threonine protein kinase